MGAPRVPSLNPSESIVLSPRYGIIGRRRVLTWERSFSQLFLSLNSSVMRSKWLRSLRLSAAHVFRNLRWWREQNNTHFCPPLRSSFAVRETASLGIMGAPRVPPLNPSETIVLWGYWRESPPSMSAAISSFSGQESAWHSPRDASVYGGCRYLHVWLNDKAIYFCMSDTYFYTFHWMMMLILPEIYLYAGYIS